MLQVVPHADVNQETDCGLMFVSHFDMQALQEQDSKGFHFQFKTHGSQLTAVCGKVQKREACIQRREEERLHTCGSGEIQRNEEHSVLFCHCIKNMSFNFVKWGCHIHFIVFLQISVCRRMSFV